MTENKTKQMTRIFCKLCKIKISSMYSKFCHKIDQVKIGLSVWFKTVQFNLMVFCFFSCLVIFQSSVFLLGPVDSVYWTSQYQVLISGFIFFKSLVTVLTSIEIWIIIKFQWFIVLLLYKHFIRSKIISWLLE